MIAGLSQGLFPDNARELTHYFEIARELPRRPAAASNNSKLAAHLACYSPTYYGQPGQVNCPGKGGCGALK